MARKPNYSFERNARARAKAKKREAKRQAKLASKAQRQNAESMPPEPDDDAPPSATAPVDPAQRLTD